MKQKFANAIKNSDELEFAIFCIESIAARLGTDAGKVYDALAQNSDILSNYIVSGYETLHTQGRDYIVEDILSVMREDGVRI